MQSFSVKPGTRYQVVCEREGRVRWVEEFHNLVVTEGMNKLLDACFKTGLTTPAWLLGLVDGAVEPSFRATDVLSNHEGWTENTAYTEGAQQAFTPGTIAAGAVDNSDSRAIFTISANGTIAGCFLTDATVIYGEGGFTGGARPVEIGDTLRVTTTVSVEE
jgi:hypothetical protein